MKSRRNSIKKRIIMLMLSAAMIFTALPLLNVPAFTAAAETETVTASGRINSDGINLRESASAKSDSLAVLKNGKKVTIYSEVFTKSKSTKASKRWYKVKAGKKTGYVRSDFVNVSKYASVYAVSTDILNYRKGPATTFKKLGAMDMGALMTLQLPAQRSGSSLWWYRAVIGDTTAYVCADYVKFGTTLFIKKTEEELQGKSDLAKALLINPTGGGAARVVDTFSSENCQPLFAIKGTKKAKVPQGMTFTGSEYHILYGMAGGQSIVTYSATGDRLRASKFAFSIGHPNGITWDPVTQLCYIFKGNTKKIYTWNPLNKEYGKARTPYSSSGVGYDNATGLLYATSRTGIRAYSSDGSFTHHKLFYRCDHGIFHYPQDCGAGGGFIFHGISGANKKTTNYLDIYRCEDYAYLGSIKVTLGEIESAVVGNDGYVRLLINTMGNDIDYIWQTPLNVNELK